MQHKIKLGNLLKVKMGFWQGEFNIMYCGMSNEDTFVLSPYISLGYQGFSPSIYYSSNSNRIEILGLGLDVIEVTKEYIILKELPKAT